MAHTREELHISFYEENKPRLFDFLMFFLGGV